LFDFHFNNIGDCTELDVFKNPLVHVITIDYRNVSGSQHRVNRQIFDRICEFRKHGITTFDTKRYQDFDLNESFIMKIKNPGSNDLRSTVFRLYRNYDGLPGPRDCLNRLSWHHSFWRKRKYDISIGVRRYEPPIQCLVIAYVFRAGDLFAVIPGFTSNFDVSTFDQQWTMNKSINIINNLFRLNGSILKDYDVSGNRYKIQFFS